MSIGSTIKRLRREKNITQEQLAEYSLFQSISSHLLVSLVSLSDISSFAIKPARPWKDRQVYLLSRYHRLSK